MIEARELSKRYGETLAVDERELGVGFADVDDDDGGRAGHAHSMWKTVASGTATGSWFGWVAMMSAM